MQKIVINLDKFQPRPYQIPMMDAILNKGYKRVMAILPRRAGKDITAFNICIRMLIRKVQTIFYVFPTYSGGRKILWDAITIDGTRVLDFLPEDLVESRNEQQMRIRLKNGSVFQIIGSDSYDTSLVGTNPGGIVFSEFALADPRAYQYSRPILAANNGWALFISTPRGKNHLWELWNIGQRNPETWFVYRMSVEDTKHIPLSSIEEDRRSGEMSEDLIQQEYYCFPAGQCVLTSSSMTSIDKILPDDMVYTHAGRIRKVLGVIQRDYSGDMIRIKSYGSCEDIVCTPNHPIRIYIQSAQSYIWKQASEVVAGDRVVFPKITLGNIPVISYELCMLIAWFITEGSCFKNGVQFTVGSDNDVARIQSLLSVLSIESVVHANGSAWNIVINSVQLVDFFKVHCGTTAEFKRIPMQLISSHEKQFFLELIKGDGCISKHLKEEKIIYSTISKTLAYQIQLLVHSLNEGYACGITTREPHIGIIDGREVNCKKSYSLQITIEGLRTHNSWMIRAKNCIAGKVISVITTTHSGPVYNLKVQYDESYLVNGRAVHNCSFEMGVEGSYYGKYIDNMRLSGQIGLVPWEPQFKVHTAWDIGVRDSTSIIFFQCVGTTVRIIDYYEKNKEGLEHYVKLLSSKPYMYGRHIAPHDIGVQEFGSGMTRIEKARQLGIQFTLSTDVGISDGIESVRSTLPKVWIDESRCAQLIKSLENYRQEFDAKRKVYNSRPLHDQFSHAADAMRYLAVSLPKTRDGLSAQDLDKAYREARHGGSQASLPNVFRDDLPKY